MDIKQLDEATVARWDRFVEGHPEATFFHRAGWRAVLQQAFAHPSYFLYAEDQGEIQGILPLGHLKSRLFGNSLVSTPFCVYGGAVAQSEQARVALEQAACDLARQLKVDYLELRNLKPSGSGRPGKSLYVTFRKVLEADHDKNMAAIPRKQRAVVRKGGAQNLVSVIDPQVDRLYDTYAESVRNLGTPVFSKKLFQALRDVFGDDCEVLSIEHGGAVVSSVMSFYFRNEVLPYYGGGTQAARGLQANDFMYWEVMRRAVERGARMFDFGRSKLGTGSYRFKTHWGFEPTPLHYEYELVRASSVPDLNPLNPKYRLFIEGWKRLPVPVSKWLGPWLSRTLG